MLTDTHFFLFIKFSTQTYVQDLASKEADAIYKLIVEEEGHIYVCGDVTMAEHVYLTMRYCHTVSFVVPLVRTSFILLHYL